ncbi:MAG: serine hydrolase, partial [Rhodothermales bacterium]
LADGVGTGYGLGVDVALERGHRLISHTGEVSGFTAANMIYPDEGAGVVVLVNLDATGAASQIARRIADALFTINDAESRLATEQARAVFEGLQQGRIDRSLFSDNANAYFSEEALADFGSSLGPLGPPTAFTMTRQVLRGGMTYRSYEVRCGNHVLRVSTFVYPDGKLEQFQVAGL